MKDIIEVLKKMHPEHDFENSTNYLDDGLLESMDIIELVARLEKQFNIEFDMMDLVPENFYNAQRISELIKKYK